MRIKFDFSSSGSANPVLGQSLNFRKQFVGPNSYKEGMMEWPTRIKIRSGKMLK